MTATTTPEGATSDHLNRIELRGRLSAAAERRELPSGDILCVFRLVVDRPAAVRGHVDTIDCASSAARVRRTMERASPGELIEVHGQLRRRFWRGPTGPSSRYEVEARSATRVVRAGRRSGS